MKLIIPSLYILKTINRESFLVPRRSAMRLAEHHSGTREGGNVTERKQAPLGCFRRVITYSLRHRASQEFRVELPRKIQKTPGVFRGA